MNKFKVGDRVRGYQIDGPHIIGVVIKNDFLDDTLMVSDKDEETYWFHYKQCRKLKPKSEKTNPDEWYVEHLCIDLQVLNKLTKRDALEYYSKIFKKYYPPKFWFLLEGVLKNKGLLR